MDLNLLRGVKKKESIAIENTLNANQQLKIRDHEIQGLIHNLAHERMQGALATPHQARYLALGQDDMIKVNQQVDHQEL